MARPLAVFDIDGVLADVRHRLHHLTARPTRWNAFFLDAGADPPLPDGVDLARHYARDHRLLYLTGRPERARGLTERWLDEHGLPRGRLLMRPDADHRPAAAYKREQVRALTRVGELSVVVDDDPSVIDALTADGVPAQLANWLPYTRVLHRAQEEDGRT